MKIKVIENAYYVSEDLTSIGLVSEDEFNCSFTHTLVKGDVWEKIDVEGDFNGQVFKCVEGEWLGEVNDGWWDYEGFEDYFEIVS